MGLQTEMQLGKAGAQQPSVFASVLEIVEASQFEILIFAAAAIAHFVIFGARHSGAKPPGAKLKLPHGRPARADAAVSGRSPSGLQTPAAAALAKQARALAQAGASDAAIALELGQAIGDKAADEAARLLAGMLESLGRAATPALLAGVRAAAQQRGLELSADLGDAMLRGYLVAGLHAELAEVLKQLEASGNARPSSHLIALKGALVRADLDGALPLLARLGEASRRAEAGAPPTGPPPGLLHQLAALAARQHAVGSLAKELSKSGLLAPQALEALLAECARQGDQNALREVEEIGRARGVAFTAGAYASLVRGAEGSQEALGYLDQASKLDGSCADVALAAAEAAARRRDAALAAAALRLLPGDRSAAPLEVVSAFLRLGADSLLPAVGAAATAGPRASADAAVLALYQESFAGVDLAADTATARLVMDAALRCGRSDLLRRLMATFDAARMVTVLKSLGAEGRLRDALAVFGACEERPACVYNTVLDACVQARDLKLAAWVMEEACTAGVADVITHNTIIKAHLQARDVRAARAALEGMRAAGVAPNVVTFNELLDASLHSMETPWKIIEEMSSCGLRPNSVTCSILLKGVLSTSKPSDVERTLAVINTMEEEMDEVLLSSVCEACVRSGRSDLLAPHLRRQRGPRRVRILGAHTYGSVIRAFGFVGDVEGVWETWHDMRSRNILPTSITLGCMIEALVSNTSPEAGHQMIEEALADESLKPLVNVVMYCSVMKGYSHQKRFDRMWDIYQEMLKHKMKLSIVTFNTLVDACSRCGEIGYIPDIIKGMEEQKVQPNIITYGAIIKGYCQENQLDQAFELLEDMKRSSSMRPDEITYNTILDGCARYGLWGKGLEILEEMQEAGVPPSNFTLSVVVKLANRSRRLEAAFELCEKLSKKYRIQPNIHVYNNLIHACVGHGQHARAVGVFVQALQGKARPDARTYTILLRGCISAGKAQDAVGLLRAAAGLPEPLAALDAPSGGGAGLAERAQLRSGPPPELISEVLQGIATQLGEERLAVRLFQELKRAPNVRVDSRLGLLLAAGRGSQP